jgi:protein-disulfide isomerase
MKRFQTTFGALRRPALAMIAVPLALGLPACGKSDEAPAAATSGEPIAKIAAPAGKAWADVVAKTPEGGYRMGNPEAPIKIIEFASLTCSHCAEFAEKSSAELRDTFVASGRVSYEMRNFVRDGIDVSAAQLTRCGAPESYFALTEQVFANQGAIIQKVQAAGEPAFAAAMAQPDDKRGIAIAQLAGLTDFFAARGIAKDQANACLADSKAAAALAKGAQDDAERYDIQGTPTFVINGDKVDLNTWEGLKARLEQMGAR